MSIEYIRMTYSVNFKIGDPVRIRMGCGSRFDGFSGRLIGTRGSWLSVKGDSWQGFFHPADVEPIGGEAANEH